MQSNHMKSCVFSQHCSLVSLILSYCFFPLLNTHKSQVNPTTSHLLTKQKGILGNVGHLELRVDDTD